MEFQEVVRHRHMVREFTAEPVAQASLDRTLANSVRGPSAGFSQGRRSSCWPASTGSR
jgi:nitroreductase